MPDWVSHVLIALIIVQIFGIKTKSLVVLGALLPDFLFKTNILSTFIGILYTEIYWSTLPMHIPLGTLFAVFIITPFFKMNYKKVFLLIAIGVLSHYLSDALFKSFLVNQQAMLLFPFSWKMFSFNLLWANEFYVVLTITIILYVLVKVADIKIKHSLNL